MTCKDFFSTLKNKFGSGKETIMERLKKEKRLIISLLLFSCSTLIFFFLIWDLFLAPLRQAGTVSKRVEIAPGTPAKKIGIKLHNDGLIRSAKAFHILSVLTGKAKKFKAGSYFFNSSMSLPEIISELEKGRPLVYRLTFPEGLTISEMARLLENEKIISADAFEAQLRDKEFLKKEFYDLSKGKTAEGFLFPDTYEFEHETDAIEIINKMTKRFREVVNEDILRKARERNLDPLQLITLASLVEKEAQKEEERAIIAAVFLNRLRKGKPLESCASVEYALKKHKEVLTYRDLQVDSPYNTYKHRGLPPGPIANPGLASIKAVLEPADVDYLYFVARPDGYHIFSRSYREHLSAQRRIKREKAAGNS